MLQGLKVGTENHIKNCLERRVVFTCSQCKKEVLLPKHLAKAKKYCSMECSKLGLKNRREESLKQATIKNANMVKEEHAEKKKKAIKWIRQNVKKIEDCKYNNIKNGLKELIEATNVADIRTAAYIITGRRCNSKELLCELKELVKMYAEPDQN